MRDIFLPPSVSHDLKGSRSADSTGRCLTDLLRLPASKHRRTGCSRVECVTESLKHNVTRSLAVRAEGKRKISICELKLRVEREKTYFQLIILSSILISIKCFKCVSRRLLQNLIQRRLDSDALLCHSDNFWGSYAAQVWVWGNLIINLWLGVSKNLKADIIST